jgi:SAM-dependent methyltransferase
MSDQLWLAAMWPFVQVNLPRGAAEVVEIGCGPLGGFVPMLLADGAHAVGVDPEAPDGRDYVRAEFETYESAAPVDAFVACTSLHHVADVGRVLDRVASSLRGDGTVIVVEWASERFDLATARWCFDRLPEAAGDDDEGWLRRHRDRWLASGRDWDNYLGDWLIEDTLHSGASILAELDARFECAELDYGPMFFADLADTDAADEQEAIDAGQIRANGIRYVGRQRSL